MAPTAINPNNETNRPVIQLSGSVRTHKLPDKMLRQFITLFTLLSVLSSVATALKFDLVAQPKGHPPRCIRNFVVKDTLVVVTATVSGDRGDGQQVNIHVSCHGCSC